MFLSHKFQLQSDMKTAELVAALNAAIAEKTSYFSRGPEEPFIGEVDSNGFKLRPAWGQGSQTVQIHGRFTDGPTGIYIDVSQSPALFFSAFMAFWILMVIAMTGIGFWTEISFEDPQSDNVFFALFPIIFIGFGFFVFRQIFWLYAAGTKFLLKLIFRAEEVRLDKSEARYL